MDNEYISGLDSLDKVLEKFGHQAVVVAGDLLYAKGEAIALDSKQNYVPVDESTLQGSIHAEEPVIEGDQASVRVVAGGPASDYAEAIHEHLSQHSPPSWKKAEASGSGVHFSQGGPKYLEKPYLVAVRGLGQWIADGIKRKMGT